MSVESVERLRKENYKKIIEAVKQLLSVKSYNNTSLEEIAKRAGVSKRTIINIFQSKSNLILLATIQSLEAFHEIMKQRINADDFKSLSGLEQIMQIHVARAKFYDQNPYVVRLIVAVEALPVKDSEQKIFKRYIKLTEDVARYYREPLKKGRQDGSVRENVEDDTVDAILFFSFGAISQRLSNITSHNGLSDEINSVEIMRKVLESTRVFLGNT